MNETKEVAAQDKQESETREGTTVEMPPPVDVYEDRSGITLYADLPGVSSERLNLKVDKDTLLIEGDAAFDIPEGMQALYADVRATRYRRSFALSSELDTAAIDANLKDGVLKVRLPKKEAYQPRKIDIQTG